MNKYQTKLIRINSISGILYWRKKNSRNLVVYGLGAPILPDSGNLPDAPVIMDYDTDLFVPDYLGYGRSDGFCTPRNCIKTFLDLYDWFKNGCTGFNYYENYQLRLRYPRVVFIGRSFGGSYVPLLPRFNKEIKELCLVYPAVDNESCGSILGEESNEDFMRAMKKDGYRYFYRGIMSPVWKKHLKNEDGLSPMDNINYLKNARLFIGHGKNDQCIHYSKSVIYYQKILAHFPERKNQFVLKLYSGSGHEPKTSNRAARDFLNWLKFRKLS